MYWRYSYFFVIKFVCVCVLLALALSDLKRRRLPNRLVFGVLLCYLLYAPMAPAGAWVHFGTGLAALLVGMGLTAAGVIGAGDAKLGAVVLCWAGPASCLPVLLVVTQVGLLLAVLGVFARQGLRHTARSRFARLLYCLTVDRGVPYGVALAAGGVLALQTAF